MTGKPQVYLVGAGPGDPGLLTLKGKEAIAEADVLIYDRLASPRLLSYARPGCELLYVGKDPNRHTMRQPEITELIVQKALAGNVVVRLKGGDPFVFGRGGEEAEALREGGIEYDIVPGVTSAIAAPAYAGIPVTHRTMASSFTVITGHEHADKDESAIPWEHVAKLGGTLVFLMGMENLSSIAANLMEHGMDGETPAAVVHYGTLPGQKTMRATLASIEERVREAGVRNPSVIVVGQVASLRERLGWFERKPLFGKTVVVTRARRQASSLTSQLERLGAQVLEFPVIEMAEPADAALLRQALAHLEDYRWLVFTSANGVEAAFAELDAQGKDARALAGLNVAAIGPGTCSALARQGIKQVEVPTEYRAEGLAALLAEKLHPGERVLIARAQDARDALPRLLEEAGAKVDDVAAYRTRPAEGGREALMAALRAGEVDAVTFASSSTVTNFLHCLGKDVSLLNGVALFSIGPITGQTLRDAGLAPRGEAAVYTIAGLVATMVESLGGESR